MLTLNAKFEQEHRVSLYFTNKLIKIQKNSSRELKQLGVFEK